MQSKVNYCTSTLMGCTYSMYNFTVHPIHVHCAYGVLNFTICALAFSSSGSDMSSWPIILWFVHFSFIFISKPIGICYIVMIWLTSSKIRHFPSVYGHKCWPVPKKKCSPLSHQTGTQRRDCNSMEHTYEFTIMMMTPCLMYLNYAHMNVCLY